jgi:hypothetical protein
MAWSRAIAGKIPAYARWLAILWLLIWIPAYWLTWGLSNFIQLCDIAVLLTCIGLFTDSSLLISSQAVSSLLIDLAWTLDAGWQLCAGHHLTGGTEYLFDPQYPLPVRLLSLYHVAMPLVLLWALGRVGYDARGFQLQCAIVPLAFIAARFTPVQKNMNFAFSDPFFHRSWGPPPVHVAVSVLFMVVVVYYPTALFLRRLIPPGPRGSQPVRESGVQAP